MSRYADYAGYSIKARPTIYRGVQMRSRTEASFAGWLDYFSIPWEYEPLCFASGAVQYLPDFRVDASCDATPAIYVEVKPTVDAAQRFVTERPYTAIFDSEPHSRVALVIPGATWVADSWHDGFNCAVWTPQDGRVVLAWNVREWTGLGWRDGRPE